MNDGNINRKRGPDKTKFFYCKICNVEISYGSSYCKKHRHNFNNKYRISLQYGPNISETFQICSYCKITKNINCFYKRTTQKGCTSECKKCFNERIGNRHQKHKDTLVSEFGGKCHRCGYDKNSRVLCFHHINLDEKSFGISSSLSKSLDVLRKEAQKCILLCPNCHAEKHLNMW